MNVLIISTSKRAGSNSEALAAEFARGAVESGHTVDFVSLAGKEIGFCRGCLACQTTHKCVISDDAVKLSEQLSSADVIAFATPVYYYGMSGQMKTLLDRCNPVYGTDYSFRDVYLLAAAADGEEAAMDGTVMGLRGWLECFEKAQLAGVVCGVGVNAPGEIKSRPDILKKAYELGIGI